MIPIKLKISGFTSYTEKEPAEIDFDGLDLACISGSNGAGKSSLLDAITYALYGKARKQDESIINSSSNKAEVTFDFRYENNTYRVVRSIARGKPTHVEFFIDRAVEGALAPEWKVLTERTLRDTDKKIEDTLRLDYETFVNASFFLQGKADSFANQKPTDRKRILSSILGLDKWETYRQCANDRANQKKTDAQMIDAQLSEIRKELDQEQARKAHLAELEVQLDQAKARTREQQTLVEKQRAIQQNLDEQSRTLELLSRQVDKAQRDKAETLTQLNEKQLQVYEFEEIITQAGEIEAVYQAYLELRDQLSELDHLAEKVNPINNRRQDLLHQLDSYRNALRQQLDYLSQEKESLERELARQGELEQEQSSLVDQIRVLQEAVNRREAVEAELKMVQSRASDLNAENRALHAQMVEIKERLSKIEGLKEANCPLCGQPLATNDRDHLAIELQNNGTALGDQYRANQKSLEQTSLNAKALEAELADIQNKERKLQTLIRESDRTSQLLQQLAEKRAQWDQERAPQLEKTQAELQEELFLPEIRQEILSIEADLAVLNYDSAAHARLREQELHSRSDQERFNELKIALATVEQLQNSVKDLRQRLKRQEAELSELQKEHRDAAARLAAESAGQPDLQAMENVLANLREDEGNILKSVGGARQELNALNTQRERQKKLQAQLDTVNGEIRNLRILEKAFSKDGVPATLISQDLPALQDMANNILQGLSNYTMSVQFNSQRAYKDSKREDKKETLDIVISDGFTTRDYETYSGGEAFRVNFAIRLALSRFLAKRAGARLQTLIIDEGFGNQDTEGRQRLIEAINAVKPEFEKILVITHIEELKDVFPNRIEVEKTEQGSRVSVIQL